MGRRTMHRMHDKRLHELDLFRLQKRRLRRDLIAVCNYLMKGNRKGSRSLFSEVHRRKIRCKRCKLEFRWIRNSDRVKGKNFLRRGWSSTGTDFPEDYQNQAGQVPEQLACLWAGNWTRWAPEFTSNMHDSVILWFILRKDSTRCICPMAVPISFHWIHMETKLASLDNPIEQKTSVK